MLAVSQLRPPTSSPEANPSPVPPADEGGHARPTDPRPAPAFITTRNPPSAIPSVSASLDATYMSAQESLPLGADAGERGNVLLRYYQDVHRRLGLEVPEGRDPIILVDDDRT